MIRFVRKIIIPYIKETRQKLGAPHHTALVLFYVFFGQTTSCIHEVLEEAKVSYIHIPGGCTDTLQPLDLTVNRPAKSFLREKLSI